ncbi:transcription factor jumonji [Tieghemostelium lacteum]|uniref:peptidylprolyl isomerase n=1 Tax=Tieghemostelium lacteum TaxID=361077 RepID=A0A152A669_TIELA|nr:transcription factor jumonji [Tieghemostelium lacteum]|eukprot:KYR01591.1 transcription factor jumonji [Tieghemostelium lacteum]
MSESDQITDNPPIAIDTNSSSTTVEQQRYYTAIFIPYDDSIEEYEIKIPYGMEEIQSMSNYLSYNDSPLKEYLSKKDPTMIAFTMYQIKSLPDEEKEKLKNKRATKIISRTRQRIIYRNALFVRFKPNIEDGSTTSVDITLEEYRRFYQFYTLPDFTVFDYENSLESSKDIVQTILHKSKFQYKDVWIYKNKSPLAILNEIHLGSFEPTGTEVLYPSGPFANYYHITGTDLVIYSKICTQQKKALQDLCHRILQYYVIRQNHILFGDEMDITPFYKTKVDFKVEREALYAAKPAYTLSSKSQLNNTVDETKNINNTDTNTNTSSIDVEDIDIFGKYKLKKDHKVYYLTDDKLLVKHMIYESISEDSKSPDIFSAVTGQYSIYLPNGVAIIQDCKLSSTLISQLDAIQGVKMGLCSMKEGDICLIRCNSKYAYGEHGSPPLIPPKIDLFLYLELKQISIRKKPSTAELAVMSISKRLQLIESAKQEGLELFKKNKIKNALNLYRKSLEYCDPAIFNSTISEDEWTKFQDLSVSMNINTAICYSKISRWDRSLTYLKQSLRFYDSAKAYYWISKAHLANKNYELAYETMQKAKELDTKYNSIPLISEIQYNHNLHNIQKIIKKQLDNEAKLYPKIFESLDNDDLIPTCLKKQLVDDRHCYHIECFIDEILKFHVLHNQNDCNDNTLQQQVSVDQLKNQFKILDQLRDLMWEYIHIGNWKDSSLILWRDIYSFSSIHYSYINMLLNHQSISDSLKPLDYALILGGPLFSLKIHSFIEVLLNYHHHNSDINSSNSRNNISKIISADSGHCDITFSNEIKRLKYLPSLQEFYNEYMVKGVPVIIENALNYWSALEKWNDITYLKKIAGMRTVPIEIGSTYLDENWSQKLVNFDDFIDKYILSNETSTSTDESTPIGYLAQTQLFNQIPALRSDIIIPDYCTLSLQTENDPNNDDDIEINAWFGPKGTTTPLHYDPKHNLFCQVVGRKYIRLYSSDESEYLYAHNDSKLLFNTSQVDIENPDLNRFPKFKEANYIESIVKQNEMLYIPPKYWHFVKSKSCSFSVSFWWN